jgi:hypothetical protein
MSYIHFMEHRQFVLIYACVFVVALSLSCLNPAVAQQSGVLQLHSKNPHYFLYKSKPTVIVGSGEHYGAVMNGDFDYTVYLRTLQQEGLNTTRLFTGAYFEKPGAFGIERNTLAPPESSLYLPWQKTGGRYDLTKWNGAFFNRLHDFMQKAEQAGVIVEATLFSSYYGAGWDYHPFNGKNNSNHTPSDLPHNKANTLQNGSLLSFQEAYVRKMVHELNRYDNLYYEIQNEPWADSKDTVVTWNDYLQPTDLKEPGNFWKATLEIASADSRAWHKAVTSWISGEEERLPKKHLISHNIANFGVPVSQPDSRISIYTFHYARPQAATLNHNLNKAIGFNETGFAGKNDKTYYRQAWRFLFSGGSLFNHLDYSFSVGYESGNDNTNNAPGGGSPALRKSFRVLKQYVEGLDLATLQPATAVVHQSSGCFAYAMKETKNVVAYVEPFLSKGAFLRLKVPQGIYLIEWTDAATGEKIFSSQQRSSSTLMTLLLPSNKGEKVVKLKKLK